MPVDSGMVRTGCKGLWIVGWLGQGVRACG